MPRAAERALVGAALLFVVVGAAWLRVAAYRQACQNLTLAADSAQYVSMAENLRHGLGLTSAEQMQAFRADPAGYRFGTVTATTPLAGFYQNDLGLSLLYALAGAIFGSRASPPHELLWLQMAVDCCNVVLVFVLVARGAGGMGGLVLAAVYAGLSPLVWLSAMFPYYYYWSACFALWNLAAIAALPSCRGRRAWAAFALYGCLLGFAAMVRSSFLALGVLSAVLLAWHARSRWREMLPLLGVALVLQGTVMAPIFWRSHQRFGAWMPPRLVWHTVYTGLGWRPNPYGIAWDDQATMQFAAQHGITPEQPDFQRRYEDLLAGEVHRIEQDDPWLLPRNAVLNVGDGLIWFDQPLSLWGLELPGAPRERGVLLLAALVLLACLMPTMLRTAIVIQGLFFVVGVSLLCPPFAAYNAAYLPTLALLLGLLLYGAGRSVTAAGSRPVALAASAATIVMWLPLGATYILWERLPLLLTVPWLRQRLGWNRTAQVALWLGVLLIAPGGDAVGTVLRWLYALWPWLVVSLALLSPRLD